jgi:hypothetical protein
MTESEKQQWLEVSKIVVDTLTPMVQAQAAQVDGFAKNIFSNHLEGKPTDIVNHKAQFDIQLFLSVLQDGVRRGERLLRTHSEIVTYLQHADATTVTVEDVLNRATEGRRIEGLIE